MKTAFGWVSGFGILYRPGRAPMVAMLALAVLVALVAAVPALAKGPVVSAPAATWYDFLLMLLLGVRNLS